MSNKRMFIITRDSSILFPSRIEILQNSRIERIVDTTSDQNHRGFRVDDEVEERMDNCKWHWTCPLE